MKNIFDERTFFPLSVVVGLFGVAMWVGSLQRQVSQNTESINFFEQRAMDSRRRLYDRLNEVDVRISRMEGKIDTLLQQLFDDPRKRIYEEKRGK